MSRVLFTKVAKPTVTMLGAKVLRTSRVVSIDFLQMTAVARCLLTKSDPLIVQELFHGGKTMNDDTLSRPWDTWIDLGGEG